MNIKRKKYNHSHDRRGGKKMAHNKKQDNLVWNKSTKISRSDGSQKKKFKSSSISDGASMLDANIAKPFHEFADSKHLIVKPVSKWFEQLPDDTMPGSISNPEVMMSLQNEAETLHKDDILRYQRFLEKRKEKSDFVWMKTILHSGTLSDKISAHTLFIQDSPVHNINSIEILVNMINPKGKRECLIAMDCLKDLFLSDLLLPDKKLRSFSQHPLEEIDKLTSGNVVSRKKRLLLWHFEDKLKSLYAKFLKNLEVVSRDTVEKMKQKAVTVMYELLKENPEQEQFLLEHLVNKIGDPLPKVGSHVCYLLGQLVDHHSNMVAVVVKEVERLLFRPNIAERAKYYCLCFLNQLVLSHEQSNIANHLITMYFGLFKMCVKKGEVNTKMMSALLIGVSRAYPYAKLKNNVVMDQLDAMFRLVHMVNFNISVQTLMLIFQVLDSEDSISDRFYCALYRKILDPAISTSSRQSMLLNLIYKALKKDVASVRVKAFVKRLIQVSLYQAPNFQCGILMLISELCKTQPNLFETKPIITYSDSDSDEHFDDVPDVDMDNPSFEKSPKATKEQVSSWIHRKDNQPNKKYSCYDPQNRNPLHAGSEYSRLWELGLLRNSFHPTISLFAHQVSHSKNINYSGDPLTDFTLIRFLDRFVYRNPKKLPENAKTNVHRKVFGRKIRSKSEVQPMAITSDMYTQQHEDKVPVDERFIYKYLRQRAASGKTESKEESDVESVGSDEFEELLDKMHPEDEGKKSLDFAKELSAQKHISHERNNQESTDSDLGTLDGESDFEDDLNLEDDDEFQSAFKEFDEDFDELIHADPDTAFKDTVDDGDQLVENQKHRRNKSKKRPNSDNLFASADEFATLLESNAGTVADTISSEAFVNYDESATKQLAWERQRDHFVKGADWKSRRNRSKRKFQVKKKV